MMPLWGSIKMSGRTWKDVPPQCVHGLGEKDMHGVYRMHAAVDHDRADGPGGEWLTVKVVPDGTTVARADDRLRVVTALRS